MKTNYTNKNYWEHFAHDADIGVRGVGVSKEDAFIQGAIGLLAVICQPERVRAKQKIIIDCSAPNDELLFVDWLNALIYEIAQRKMLFNRFTLTLEKDTLHAFAWGEPIDPVRHQPAVEIKGATYTELQVYQTEDAMWHAQTVVDV
jgi:tRNA nucleotidyltransferase (CCA-adding enzyme)